MDGVGTAVTALGLSGLVAAGVAIIKGLWVGEMPPRAVVGSVALLTAILIGLAAYSGAIHGNVFELVATWLLQSAGAIGLRELTVTATNGAASNFPSRTPNGVG